MKMLYWINVHYACYGVIVEDGVIIEAPPIAKWSTGKTFEEFQVFVKKKKGIIKGKKIA